jgi:hypothetical protein
MIKKYALVFLISCLFYLLIPINRPLDGYYYLAMGLFASGITLKAWDVFTLRPSIEERL